MQRISSNWTIILKIFFPTVWITFFGMLTLAILLMDRANLPFGGGLIWRMGFLAGFLIFLVFMYFTIMKLKRVDFGNDGIYISNYFKTYRYAYIDIQEIKEIDYGVFQVGTIVLKEKGKLGRKLHFIISKVHYKDFIEQNPDFFTHLQE